MLASVFIKLFKMLKGHSNALIYDILIIKDEFINENYQKLLFYQESTIVKNTHYMPERSQMAGCTTQTEKKMFTEIFCKN